MWNQNFDTQSKMYYKKKNACVRFLWIALFLKNYFLANPRPNERIFSSFLQVMALLRYRLSIKLPFNYHNSGHWSAIAANVKEILSAVVLNWIVKNVLFFILTLINIEWIGMKSTLCLIQEPNVNRLRKSYVVHHISRKSTQPLQPNLTWPCVVTNVLIFCF